MGYQMMEGGGLEAERELDGTEPEGECNSLPPVFCHIHGDPEEQVTQLTQGVNRSGASIRTRRVGASDSGDDRCLHGLISQ
uniref:uncharacterized protein LOC109968084 isoform X2 n=1 Tax=Monopterus albus TaxID=43700 RepID=UPI0009B49622|nr:uncharacterized protein LOC109968084 isoform X2 [Monopterus albus]